MSERDGKPDSLADFPEEFEQHPDGPPRDQARRTRAGAAASREALARIDALRKKVEALARGEDGASEES